MTGMDGGGDTDWLVEVGVVVKRIQELYDCLITELVLILWAKRSHIKYTIVRTTAQSELC